MRPVPKLTCPQFQRSVQRARSWPSKSELLNLGPVNLASGATRLGSWGLYWLLCDAAVIKKKKISGFPDFGSPILSEFSSGSSAEGS